MIRLFRHFSKCYDILHRLRNELINCETIRQITRQWKQPLVEALVFFLCCRWKWESKVVVWHPTLHELHHFIVSQLVCSVELGHWIGFCSCSGLETDAHRSWNVLRARRHSRKWEWWGEVFHCQHLLLMIKEGSSSHSWGEQKALVHLLPRVSPLWGWGTEGKGSLMWTRWVPEEEKWRDIVKDNEFVSVWMWVDLCWMSEGFSWFTISRRFFRQLTFAHSLSPSDPLEVKSPASAEWSGSHKGMNTHTSWRPVSVYQPAEESLFVFLNFPVCLCLWLLTVVSQQSRAGNRPSVFYKLARAR